VALVASFSVASLWLGRRRPYLLVGWFWFLGTLVPVIGLIQWGNQAMADRFLYVPSVGLFVALAWGLGELLGRWRLPKPAVASVAALVLLALAFRSRDQLRYWRDSEALFRHALDVTENNYFAHNNLGAALFKKGRTQEAMQQFHEAIRLRPDEANACFNLGNALVQQGQIDAATTQFQEAARLKPSSALVHYNLGAALGNQGQTDAAISQFQEAIRLQPAYPEALGSLAGTLDGQGKYAEAIRLYQAALKIQPDQDGILNNLAWLLATCPDAAFRSGPQAVRLATRACELTSYTQPLLVGTLAAAQAEAGDFQAAIASAERAAALADTLHLEQVAVRNRELLQLYRQGQPFHEKRATTTDPPRRRDSTPSEHR
jgi:Tfp pilus assembly protein PilF